MTTHSQDAIQVKIQQVLRRTASILFPNHGQQVEKLIKRHVWRDRQYVGELGGKVCVWSGYSINLAYLDAQYRGLYGDYVANQLPLDDRYKLFGDEFTKAIEDLDKFVVIFNLDMPLEDIELIKSLNFVPRRLLSCCHSCLIYDPEIFWETALDLISARVVEMVRLQFYLAKHSHN